MSSIIETVNNDLKEAMKSRDEARLRALRNIKSAFLLLQTSGSGAAVTDEDCIKSLQKLAKQRKDSLEIFAAQNREDLAQKEREELAVIEAYLPAMMNAEQIRAEVTRIIAETGASGPADMGKVIPLAMKAMAGKADGRDISAAVKELLSQA